MQNTLLEYGQQLKDRVLDLIHLIIDPAQVSILKWGYMPECTRPTIRLHSVGLSIYEHILYGFLSQIRPLRNLCFS